MDKIQYKKTMNYGLNIKNARKKLSLNQKDISSLNLSRNFISNIEAGKSRLTPGKAFIIFKKIIEFAARKSMYIELEFDELLSNNEEYNKLKKGYAICKRLNDYIEDDENINLKLSVNDIEKYIKYADKNDIGLLRYFIYYYSALIIEEDEYKIQMFFKALDYLKWNDIEFVLELYKNCLIDSLMVAYKYSRFDSLIHYYNVLLEGERKFKKKVDVNIYYNLALFYDISEKYDLSLKNLERYFESSVDMSKERMISTMIIKATILTKTNRISDGLKLYEDIMDKLKNTNIIYQKSICLSNIIYNISKYKLENRKDFLVQCLNELIDILEDCYIFTDIISTVYSNIGQGYFYLKDYENSKKNFVESLKHAPTDDRKILVLKESYKTYLMNNELDILIKEILAIDKRKLNFKRICMFYELLLKIQSNTSIGNIEKDNEFSRINNYIATIN